MKRKIAVNAVHLAGRRKASGVGRYVANILWRLGAVDSGNSYCLFSPACDPRFLSARVRHIFLPPGKGPYSETIVNSPQWKRIRPDLFFSPHAELPGTMRGMPPTVCTVHDIVPTQFLTPEFLLRGKTSLKLLTVKGVHDYFVLRKRLLSAKRIITVSHCSRKAIAKVFGRQFWNKISVVRNGVDPVFASAKKKNAESRCRGMNLSYKKYLIYFGGHAVRKNLVRTVEAYQRLDRETRRECPFVVVGEGYQKDMILKKKLDGNVVFVPEAGDMELAELVSGAAASVYPSLLEGFGLPVVESLAAGVAPLVSNIPSNREILGADYPMFNPCDVDDIHRILKTFLKDPEALEKLCAGRKNELRRFDWEKAAGQTAEILNEALFRQ